MNQQKFNDYVTLIEKKNITKAMKMWDNKFITIKTNYSGNKCTLLHIAAMNGVPQLITFFIEKGMDVDVLDERGRTALHCAAQNGHCEVVTFLLQHRVNINILSKGDYSALHYAAEKGHHNVATLLLQHGANVDLVGDKWRFSALHCAAANGQCDVMTLLLRHGANVNLLDDFGSTPIKLAKSRNHLKCVAILKEFQASIIQSDNVDEFRKVFGNGGLKLTKMIVSLIGKIKPEKIIKYICSCFITEEEAAAPKVWQHEAIFHKINLYRSIKLTQCKMFEDTASIELINADALFDNKCALHLAVESKSQMMVNEVIKLINDDNNIINSMLHNYQDRSNNMLIVLQNRKALLEAFYKRGYTRLDIAVMDCSKVMLQHLLEKETNKKVISKALSIAIDNNCQQCVKIITEKNVDYNYINKMGQTLMHLAIERGNTDICKILIDNCTNFAEKDYLGLTALHRAVMYDEESLIEKMMEKDKYWNKNFRIIKPWETSILGTLDDYNNISHEIYQNQFHVIYDQLTTKENTLSLYIKANNCIHETFLNVTSEKAIQFQDGLGNTALHTAVYKCNVDTCRKIIEISKRTLNIKNFENLSPLRLAVRKFKENCINKVDLLNNIKCLIQMGATLEQDEFEMKSILQEAINNDNEELLIELMKSEETITVLTDAEFQYIIERQFYTFLQYLSDKLHKGVACQLMNEDRVKDLFKESQYSTLIYFFQHLNSEVKKVFVNEFLYIAYKLSNRDLFVNLCKLNDVKPNILYNGETIMTLIINDENKEFFSYLLDSTYATQLVNMSNYTKNLPIHLIVKKEWYNLAYSLVKDTENVDEENEEGDTPIAILMKQLGNITDDIVRAKEVINLIYALITDGSSNVYRVSNVSHKSPITDSGKYRLKIEEYYKKHGKVKQVCGASTIGVETTDTFDELRKLQICFICDDRRLDCVLDCGHIFCSECIKQVDRCPTCREQIRNPRKLFF